jgi:hypothetical protein
MACFVPETSVHPCERCGATTVQIALLAGEQRLTMHSCSRCDHRMWRRAGERVAIGTILDSVAETGRRRTA